MRNEEQEHPDRIADEKSLTGIVRGGNHAIEDIAISAYLAAYNAGNQKEAERMFFEIHANAAKRV